MRRYLEDPPKSGPFIIDFNLRKEELSESPFKIVKKVPEGIILQFTSRDPEDLWVPSDGLNQYRIIFEGKEYEYLGRADEYLGCVDEYR